MKKIVFKLLDFNTWLHKHKKTAFVFRWFVFWAIMTLTNVSFTSWQYWAIFFLYLVSMLLYYGDGRLDEEESNGDVLEQLKPDIKNQIYNAIADVIYTKTGRTPKIEVTEQEMN